MDQIDQTTTKAFCRWCNSKFDCTQEEAANYIVSNGSCPTCSEAIFKSNNIANIRDSIELIDDPVLVLQPEPRLVYTANNKAGRLFNKDISQMEGVRGGQVFDCIQSFTEAGCGKDLNCEKCTIKQAIVDTLNTGNSFEGLKSPLDVKRGDNIISFILQISTEKVGDFALVRIDEYKPVK